MQLDLTPATLTFDWVGISKPAGFPASSHAVATFGEHSLPRTENMIIIGPSLQARLTMTFDDQGTLATLDAPTVKSGATNDFAFFLKRGASGVDITIRGHSIDGTRLASRGSSAGAKGGAGGGGGGKGGVAHTDSVFDEAFHIDARLDRVALRNGVAIAPFALDVSGVAERPASMTLTGSLGKAGDIKGGITPGGDDRKLTLTASDFGTLARGLFGFKSIKGGKFEFIGTLHGSASAPGNGGAANDFEGIARVRISAC